MPFNGSGTFTREHSWIDDRNNTIKITADRHDEEDDNFADGITACIAKDGQSTTSARVPFAQGIGLASGTAGAPALNFTSDTNSGLYSVEADSVGIATGGGTRLTVNSTTTTAAGIFKAASLRPDTTAYHGFPLVGGKLVPSVASNALTIAIKTIDGNDPSTTEPVAVYFRSATAADGAVTPITITAATSLVISSGSTLGFPSGKASRLWVGGFNDGGTFRLAAVNCATDGGGVFALSEEVIQSATAEGGAGGADSASVIYAGAAVTNKAFRLLGYLEWSNGLTTAGTWNANADIWVPFGPGVRTPGSVVQSVFQTRSDMTTGTATIPADDTIPQQSTEGNLFMSRAITPFAAANFLVIEWNLFLAYSTTGQLTTALFHGATEGAVAVTSEGYRTAADYAQRSGIHVMRPGSTSNVAFKVHAGGNNAGTVTLNGASATRQFGGVATSTLRITEIMG